jgi:hypothetical protein
VKRGRLAIAAATLSIVAAAVSGTDGPRSSAPAVATPVASATPSTASVMVSPLWRIDLPSVGGPFTARFSPGARLVAVEAVNARTGVVIHEIQPPVPPSDVARLRELVRLDRVAGPIQWLPDSSGLLAYEPDYPSAPTGALSLVGTSGKRWSVATRGEVGPVHSARYSPDGRYVAFSVNPPRSLAVALDSGATYPLFGDQTQHFAGWDTEGNLLIHLKDENTLEARTLDGRVVYTVAIPDDLRELGASVPTFQQPRDVQVVTFYSGGCCQASRYAHRVLFDRKLHEFPAGLEPLLMEIGDGPWRGRELMMRRESDAELIAFDPRTGATRMLGAKLPDGGTRWGFSGDYLAWGRHIVQLSTGRDEEWTVQPPPESINALDSGRFVLWRDGTTELLDAATWFAAPQSWTGELPLASDQSRVPAGWVRVLDDDGGFTLARPRSWSSYEGRARGATLASSGLSPTALPSGGDVRVEIRLDIVGPRGPADFLDGLGHHGGRVIERQSVQLIAGVAEFAVVYDNTMYPKPATTLNWALRSPYLPERVVWIRAWPLDSGRRAEVEAIVATLEFVAPR